MADSILFYLSKFLFPLNLSPFYPYPNYDWQNPQYYVPIIGFLSITFICIYLWTKQKYIWLIGWLFYLIAISPTI